MLIVFHRTDSRQLLLAHRKPLEYGQVVSNVQAVQDVFQEVNSSLLVDSLQISGIPDGLFRAEMINTSNDRLLRVLSLGMSINDLGGSFSRHKS